ncbi:hypothetical protein M409DRAFT_26381 [Zasmidium cellare ATCC 36951]|uniref:Uncharacterized protein n=1 Tax=Zasmidium cellare ATCC 36951 TaxID=1080233 RepID=A0A6A6C873_ZASCE|nr:uncharacterized protein M409DRAFT_26381 [Zasmidium cellare ATCC 36951]KAF2163344.1 hypothetical protein M409DRAFT_26381 [Zasmidium cellare ATCC 36951]
MDKPLCLCFPCILNYLGGYVFPRFEHQYYPILSQKGFTEKEQAAIAEEWYWVAVERETAVKDYLNGTSIDAFDTRSLVFFRIDFVNDDVTTLDRRRNGNEVNLRNMRGHRMETGRLHDQ